MCVSILDRRSVSSVLTAGHSTLVGRQCTVTAGHSTLVGRQFLPMLSSLPGFRIGILSVCFLRWRVLIPSGPIAEDDLANRIAFFCRQA